jgi:hypothetical protein
MQNPCTESCISCQMYNEPSGNITYQCIVENKDSNTIIVIIILFGILILIVLVIVLLIKLRNRNILHAEPHGPIETKKDDHCDVKQKESEVDDINIHNTIRNVQPQQIVNILKGKLKASMPVSEEAYDKLVLSENLCPLQSLESPSPKQSPYKKKRSLLRHNYKQLKQKELCQCVREIDNVVNRYHLRRFRFY